MDIEAAIIPTATANARFPYALFLLLMTFDASNYLIEKTASIHAEGSGFMLVVSYLQQPWLWMILAVKLGQLWTWTRILSRVDISRAFPITALATPLTMLAAVVVFNERQGPWVWIGTTLITAGVMLVGPHARPGEEVRR